MDMLEAVGRSAWFWTGIVAGAGVLWIFRHFNQDQSQAEVKGLQSQLDKQKTAEAAAHQAEEKHKKALSEANQLKQNLEKQLKELDTKYDTLQKDSKSTKDKYETKITELEDKVKQSGDKKEALATLASLNDVSSKPASQKPAKEDKSALLADIAALDNMSAPTTQSSTASKHTDMVEPPIMVKDSSYTGGGKGNPSYLAELEKTDKVEPPEKVQKTSATAAFEAAVEPPASVVSAGQTGGRGNPMYAAELKVTASEAKDRKVVVEEVVAAPVVEEVIAPPTSSGKTGGKGNPMYAAELKEAAKHSQGQGSKDRAVPTQDQKPEPKTTKPDAEDSALFALAKGSKGDNKSKEAPSKDTKVDKNKKEDKKGDKKNEAVAFFSEGI